MSDTRKKFYLTTPIYYVNARPHIGHAYTTIVADVLARRHRLLGDDTFFLTGTDEHGQKIERSAAAAGIPPQQFADQVSIQFRNLWDRMGLTYDGYIRTTDDKHKRGAQKLFAELYERGAIYLSSYTGQYSIGEEIFVEGPPGTLGPDGKPTETVTEENFFFRLSDYQLPLIDLIESDTLAITPESRKNEVLGFLRGNVEDREAVKASIARMSTSEQVSFYEQANGNLSPLRFSASGEPYVPGNLRDLSVSRSSFTWGIPVPEPAASATEKKHVMYVWLDALANYMTAVGYGSDDPKDQAEFAHYWPADVHIMAKEITRQHCVYWPAFLLAAGLPLPKAVTAHGWLLFDNSKMSKSKGNIVRTETILDAFGDHVYGKQFPDSTKAERDLFAADVLRYFLLREIPFGQDGSFSFDALITRYNADLANGYGNLVSRTLKLVDTGLDGSFLEVHSMGFVLGTGVTMEDSAKAGRYVWTLGEASFPDELWDASPQLDQAVSSALTARNFSLALETLLQAIKQVDGLLSESEPWKIAKDPSPESKRRLNAVLYSAAEAIRIISALLHPILPAATAKVWAQLGLGDIEAAARNGELNNLQWGGLKPGAKLGPLAPIFPRADKGLTDIMNAMENPNSNLENSKLKTEQDPSELTGSELRAQQNPARPEAPLKQAATPTPAQPVTDDPTHPAAGPRSLDEPSGILPVGGSSSLTTERHATPPHTEAPASGIFAAPLTTNNQELTTPQITIDDFAKVELRVAEIKVAERIPKADKLLRLEVDLGYERRQILSGIAEWYAPEDLIGRRIVVITNLAPRKMRGLESHGMLLAASEGENGKPVLATFGEDIALGSRLK